MTKEQSNYIEVIKTMKRSEAIGFIRACLTNDDGEKLKFNMSGYDSVDASNSLREMGICTVHNQKVLNVFAYLGLYDYTDFLFLDFYKGGSRLYFKYWNDDELYINEDFTNGHSTSEIIYEIFTLTILSNKTTRRRLDNE
tara:strand:- start:1339 stop:1758 length:420 start_codon:yes stop_codon:yes gene_type:complete